MATLLLPSHPVAESIFRRYRAWRLYRALQRVTVQARAEIVWLRSQLALAHATNKRISEVNEQYSAEITALKEEIEKLRVIDPTQPCSACGNRHGNKLKAITEGVQNQKGRVVVQLTCGACTFQQALSPVKEHAFEVWQPTPGEDEIQKGILGL